MSINVFKMTPIQCIKKKKQNSAVSCKDMTVCKNLNCTEDVANQSAIAGTLISQRFTRWLQTRADLFPSVLTPWPQPRSGHLTSPNVHALLMLHNPLIAVVQTQLDVLLNLIYHGGLLVSHCLRHSASVCAHEEKTREQLLMKRIVLTDINSQHKCAANDVTKE